MLRFALRLRSTTRRAVLSLTELESRRTPASFAGVNQQDEVTHGDSSFPPDTMGAVGPNHFVELINSAFAVYSKSGSLVKYQTQDSFFAFTANGTTFPRGSSFDPRIRYDQHSGHWFATSLEFGSANVDNDLLLAVSRTNDPTGTWDKYDIPVGVAAGGSFTDYDTLGVDDNGVYFGVTIFPSSGNSYAKIVATPKAPLIAASPSLGTVTQFTNITDMFSSPEPATNYDAISGTSPAFFVASSATSFGNIKYRTLTWSNGTPTLSGTQTVVTPGYGGSPLPALALGSTTAIDTADDRLQSAVIRNHQLWTARDEGLDSTGNSTTTADRTGIEWFDLNANTATLSVLQRGRIFDSAASDPRFYYDPGITVTGQGNARIGYSGSKSTEFIGAYSSGRLASDGVGFMSTPGLIKAGERSYNKLDQGVNRWGDYSYSSVDPNDNMTAWTIQEYASTVNPSADRWGTWVQSFAAPAPTLSNPAGSGTQGQTGVTLNLTGTNFYDPGAGFLNHLQAQLTGGSVNGISNVVTTYNSPISATVTFDIAANATPGARDIVLTNPDGQSVTVSGGFTVNAAAVAPTVQSVVVNDGSNQRSEVRSITVTFSGPVTFAGGNANAAAAFQLNHVQTGNNVALTAAVSMNAGNQTVVMLTFSGTETDAVSALNGGVPSLADGRYTLTISSASVTGSGGQNLAGGGPSGNYVSPTDTFGGTGLHLYRLFGDVSGDGVVDATDLGQFRSTFNANNSQANYLAYLDADNSGAVDASDLGQFRSRFNVNVF
ncbi:MAG TPA: dockerin type I domain-containing protein [Gemmataceae bacterium]|nr:dockerin type I domain-containing protein [Gemmataceae bacterium]